MVSESLKLTFNLLTIELVIIVAYSLLLRDVIFSNLECVFLENNKMDLREFFSGFRKKH